MSIFCYQCQEAAGGRGCHGIGRCGKDEMVGNLQNLLIAWCKHIASSAVQMQAVGVSSDLVDQFLLKAVYSTLTNVSFDASSLANQLYFADRVKQVADLLSQPENITYQVSLEEQAQTPVDVPLEVINELAEQGKAYSVEARQQAFGPLVAGLQEFVLAGIKGAVAYTWHSISLSRRAFEHLELDIRACQRELKGLKTSTKDRVKKTELNRQIAETQEQLTQWRTEQRNLLDGLWAQLAFLANDSDDTEALLSAAMEVGRLNLVAMEHLERSHFAIFGKPEPIAVSLTPTAGKCILVSGHDLGILKEVLDATKGEQINVYTHGEMLPAHSYPQLKQYPHLVGHYGGAWHLQQKEFGAFPGAILMTSNCLQEPDESYRDYIFATQPVASGLVQTIPLTAAGRHDYSPLIRAALDSPGFFKPKGNERITVGFGADAIIAMYDRIEKAMQQNHLKRFYLIGGCDGCDDSRSYFTELAKRVPANGVILTLGCGKYRFNREAISPFPWGLSRLLDMGQCNDAYGAIRLVQFLMNDMKYKINQLPLSVYLSWYEQKAIAVLLSLLSLGMTNIHVGPTLPAFLTHDAIDILVDRFQLKPTTTPENDIKG